jgi:hypothetical protein
MVYMTQKVLKAKPGFYIGCKNIIKGYISNNIQTLQSKSNISDLGHSVLKENMRMLYNKKVFAANEYVTPERLGISPDFNNGARIKLKTI